MGALLILGLFKGPHTNAGKLLIDFLMSDEGQAIFRDADYMPTNPAVAPKNPRLRPDGTSFRAIYMTPEETDEQMSAWTKVYNEIFR